MRRFSLRNPDQKETSRSLGDSGIARSIRHPGIRGRPQSFPQRRTGSRDDEPSICPSWRLLRAEGYEATFLVLAGNPIQDFGAVKKIELRVKQGALLR
jgi:hypothetical protein